MQIAQTKIGEIADAITHLLKLLYPADVPLRLYGQCTGIGGGGIL